MSGNSSVSGYITPLSSPAPAVDAALGTFLHDIIAGVLAFDGALVRPRWQPKPPNQPGRDVNWIAFGVLRAMGDTYANIQHDSEDEGTDELVRHETIEVRVSAYGPDSMGTILALRDGLQIAQNRDVLTANGMGLQETEEAIRVPELTKDEWLDRWDMSLIIRRQVRRVYTVYNLLSAQGEIVAADPVREVPFEVEPVE